jgi:hypothetical protein
MESLIFLISLAGGGVRKWLQPDKEEVGSWSSPFAETRSLEASSIRTTDQCFPVCWFTYCHSRCQDIKCTSSDPSTTLSSSCRDVSFDFSNEGLSSKADDVSCVSWVIGGDDIRFLLLGELCVTLENIA